MASHSEHPEPEPVESAEELQAENARLRDQLDKAQTILTGIGSQVDLWREWSHEDAEIIERQGPPRGRWVEGGDDQ